MQRYPDYIAWAAAQSDVSREKRLLNLYRAGLVRLLRCLFLVIAFALLALQRHQLISSCCLLWPLVRCCSCCSSACVCKVL